MSTELQITKGDDKEAMYHGLLPQIVHLVSDEPDVTANLANIAAALKEAMGFLWVGFYIARENQLVLGPFQGPVACTRIARGKGVCGTAWEERRTVRVDDVDTFPGHIACSSLSRSEIVVPVFCEGHVAMVLDIDSERPAAFDHIDETYLTRLSKIIEEHIL